ncbi:hypothetical protein OUZ56_033312 [Daphnia magna]|uniref:Endonuclease/exonuclease/phosphatase domain-containing protein n=1 Tax=Daphnia magna TaxID=35525 RepID=A0ABR0BAM5_9CRUS|nr:hypothetical protein OUZ56_033312 [Daphnia magna]
MTLRLKIASINIGGKQAKNERNTFLRQTVPAYSVTTRLPFVLMGDFNCVDDMQDRANTQSLPIPSSVVSYALKEMVTGLDPDHQSVQTTLTCNLDLPKRSRSSAGLWKLNTLILSEEGYQKYELAEADTFDWVAFHQLRKFSKSWEESTLKGYGIRSRCFEGPEVEEAKPELTTVSVALIKSLPLMALAYRPKRSFQQR